MVGSLRLAHPTRPFRAGHLPDGQIGSLSSLYRNLCQASFAKIFLFRFSEMHDYVSASRCRKEGRIAIVTDVGSGMRWTCWRRETNAAGADGEVVLS